MLTVKGGYDDVNYQIRRYSKGAIYSYFANANFILRLLIALGIVWLYYCYFGLPETYSIPLLGIIKHYFPDTVFGENLRYIGFGLYTFLLTLYLRFPLESLFPKVQFNIGDKCVLENRKTIIIDKIFWNIIVAFLVNLAILLIQVFCFD